MLVENGGSIIRRGPKPQPLAGERKRGGKQEIHKCYNYSYKKICISIISIKCLFHPKSIPIQHKIKKNFQPTNISLSMVASACTSTQQQQKKVSSYGFPQLSYRLPGRGRWQLHNYKHKNNAQMYCFGKNGIETMAIAAQEAAAEKKYIPCRRLNTRVNLRRPKTFHLLFGLS